MRKIISFMHISLDGFVAGPNGEMNWINVEQEMFDHVSNRIGKTDTALYGRVTYEMMENYWPTAGDKPNASRHDKDHSKWYKTAQKIVLSKTMDPNSYRPDLNNTTVINDNLSDSINEIKQSANGGSKDILLFGSPTATHALIELNLIDGYWLFVNPIILGKGIPLFTNSTGQIKLKLLTSKTFTSGVTELNYILEKPQ